MAASSSSSRSKEEEREAQEIVKLARRSYYAVLGLESGACGTSISKAYKKQALRFHPDKNAAPSAEAAMRAVNLAFEVLSDSCKRDWYDYHGSSEESFGTATSSASSSNANSSASGRTTAAGVDDVGEASASLAGAQIDAFIKSIPRREASFRQQVQEATADKWHLAAIFAMAWAFALVTVLSGGGGAQNPAQPHAQQRFSFVRDEKLAPIEHWTYGKRVLFYTDKSYREFPVDSVIRRKVEAAVEAQRRRDLLQQCVDDKVEMEKAAAPTTGTTTSRACLELEVLFRD